MTRPAALVTGGSTGIGWAIADELARRGHDLSIVARGTDRLRHAANSLERAHGVKVSASVADLADRSDVDRVAAEHLDTFGGVDVLVNNAGVTGGHEIGRISTSEIDEHLEVNLHALIHLTDRLTPGLVSAAAEKGRANVFNIASMLAVSTAPRRSVYTAVKHGVLGFTRGMNADLAASGVYATALCPSYVATDRTAPLAHLLDPHTLIQPQDVAAAVGFVLTLTPAAYVSELMLQRPNDTFGLSEQIYPPVREHVR